MARQHPCQSASAVTMVSERLLHDPKELVAIPGAFHERKVEHLAEFGRARIAVGAAVGRMPCFGDGHAGRVVFIEDLPPVLVDHVDLVAVVQRIGTVDRQLQVQIDADCATGAHRSFASVCAMSTRNPSTPRSAQNRSVSRKYCRTSSLPQLRSGCSLVNRWQYHCPSGTRSHALPPKCDRQSDGGAYRPRRCRPGRCSDLSQPNRAAPTAPPRTRGGGRRCGSGRCRR